MLGARRVSVGRRVRRTETTTVNAPRCWTSRLAASSMLFFYQCSCLPSLHLLIMNCYPDICIPISMYYVSNERPLPHSHRIRGVFCAHTTSHWPVSWDNFESNPVNDRDSHGDYRVLNGKRYSSIIPNTIYVLWR
jgi:hypothetical protein